MLGEAGRIDTDEIVAVSGNTANVRSLDLMASGPNAWTHQSAKDGTVFQGIPGALIHPARNADEAKVKAGDLVFAETTSNMPELVRVKSVAGKLAIFDRFDNSLLDKTAEFKSDAVEPYGKPLAPFSYAVCKEGSAQRLVLVLSVVGDKIVGTAPGGDFHTEAKTVCKAVKPDPRPRKAGDKVWAFDFSGTGTEGKVTDVKLGGLSYKVGYSTLPWDRVFDKI